VSGRRRKEEPSGGTPDDGRSGRPVPSGEANSGGAGPHRRPDRRDPYGSGGGRDPYGTGGGRDPYSGSGGGRDPYGTGGGHAPYGAGGGRDPYGGYPNDPAGGGYPGGPADDRRPGQGRDGYIGPGLGRSGVGMAAGGYGGSDFRSQGYGNYGTPSNGPGQGLPPRSGPGGAGQSGAGQSGAGQSGHGRGGSGSDGYGRDDRSPGDTGHEEGGRRRARSGSGGGGRRRAVRRRSLGTLIGPLAGAIGLAILLGAGVYALAGPRGCGGDDAIKLSVAAAPEIAPAISEVAKSFDDARHSVGGKCVQATVKSSDPAGMSTVLSGGGSVPGEADPDVWIPDSSLWVTMVRSTAKGASSVHLTPTSLAKTPIVVATSRTFADKIRREGIRPTWDMLLKATDALAAGAVSKNDMLPANSVHLQILDPNRNAGGIGAVVMTRELLQGDPNADPIFTQIVRNVQNSLSPTPQALFASFHRDLHGRAPVVIVPEQAVWKFNHGNPSTPATALYPSEGLLSLDYPFTLATDDDAKVKAADLLEQALSGTEAKKAVRALGFRTPDGRPGDGFTAQSGLSPRVPRALPTPAAGDVTDVMQAWTKLSLRTRMLTLLDVSGSMAQPVGNGLTRMEATAQVAQNGLAMLPDDTDLGLWTFSTDMNGSRDYRSEVPIGPLSTRLGSGTRRQAILSALGRVRPNPTGNTGLYDSVLASVRSLQKSYKPGYYHSVLVLTDGKNDDDNGISLSALLHTLKKEADPDRPVMVVFIGFGPDVDMSAMQKIAAETNGEAFHALKPQDVQRFLLEAIARRICAPQCR
jgi:hypothetical protein